MTNELKAVATILSGYTDWEAKKTQGRYRFRWSDNLSGGKVGRGDAGGMAISRPASDDRRKDPILGSDDIVVAVPLAGFMVL
jgi:hypothetical protein